MQLTISTLLLCLVLLNGCVPSLQYRLGQGFYSDTHAKTQVLAAANAGRLKNLGRFSIDSTACWNWTQDMTDQNIVIPAIRQKLTQLGGNAADNIVANQPFSAIFVSIFGFPAACTEWTISGEALLVEQMSKSESSIPLRKVPWSLLTRYDKR